MANTETYLVKIVGTKPLLMNAPTDIAWVGDKPKLRRGERLDPKDEAERKLYKDSNGKIVIPSVNIKAMIRDAGTNYRVSGRRTTYASLIRAGIDINPYPYVPLIHNGWQVDIRPVVVQKSRILRARPRFDEWALEFEIINKDPTMLHKDILKRIIEDAGKWYGLGDWRPEFGLFKLEKFETKT